MKQIDAENFIACGVIESVTAFKPRKSDGWELWLTGERLPASIAQRLETARGEIRQFRSLDTLADYVRMLGWSGTVTFDEAR